MCKEITKMLNNRLYRYMVCFYVAIDALTLLTGRDIVSQLIIQSSWAMAVLMLEIVREMVKST